MNKSMVVIKGNGRAICYTGVCATLFQGNNVIVLTASNIKLLKKMWFKLTKYEFDESLCQKAAIFNRKNITIKKK